MSIKKTETDIREDIKKMKEELNMQNRIKTQDKNNFLQQISSNTMIAKLVGKIEYAKTLIDY